jgi:EPS-associated MarR family transcriptional regulator
VVALTNKKVQHLNIFSDTISKMKLNPTHLGLLRLLEQRSNLNQRDIASELEISLGKANYCLKALIDKGYLKIKKFNSSKRKALYIYHLTPKGIQAKANLTVQFLKHKMVEYDQIKKDIKELDQEVQRLQELGMLSTTNIK